MASPDRHPAEGPGGAGGGSWADLARLCATAEAAARSGSLDEAEALYSVVLDREPGHALAGVGVADVTRRRALELLRRGRHGAALETCRAARALDGTPGTAIGATLRSLLVVVARERFEAGDTVDAQRLLEESIRAAMHDGHVDDVTVEHHACPDDERWGILVARAALAATPGPQRAAELVERLRRGADALLPDGVDEAITLLREAVRLAQGHGLAHDAGLHERFAALLIAQARPALARHDAATALDLAVAAIEVHAAVADDEELLSSLVATGEAEGLYAPAAALARAQHEREPERADRATTVVRLLRRDGDARRERGDVQGALTSHRDALHIERTCLGPSSGDDRAGASALLHALALDELAEGEPVRAGALLAEALALSPDGARGDALALPEVSVTRRIAALRELVALRPSIELRAKLVALLHERAVQFDAQGEPMRARHAFREALSLQERAGGLAAAPDLCADAARGLRVATRILLESGDVPGGLRSYMLAQATAAHAPELDPDPDLDTLLKDSGLEAADRRLQSGEVAGAAWLVREITQRAGTSGETDRMAGRILRTAASLADWTTVIGTLRPALSIDAELSRSCAGLIGREALAAERRGDLHGALRCLRRGHEVARLAGGRPEAGCAEAHLRVLVRLAEHRIEADAPRAARPLLAELRALAPDDDRLATLEGAAGPSE